MSKVFLHVLLFYTDLISFFNKYILHIVLCFVFISINKVNKLLKVKKSPVYF